jgi:type IV pilus assembly protein PilA
MKTLQRGFTLIELMIVVAIIGILAAIAVPAYQDYTIRSRVSEAASMSSAAKTAIDVAFSENGSLSTVPITHATLGLSTAGSYSAKYVRSVTVGQDGNSHPMITVQLRGTAALGLGDATGDTVIYTTSLSVAGGSAIRWRVSSGSTVPAKYRPKD